MKAEPLSVCNRGEGRRLRPIKHSGPLKNRVEDMKP